MKRLYSVISFLPYFIYLWLFVGLLPVAAQSPSLDWVINPPAVWGAVGHSVVVGNGGSVYVTGTYTDTVDFDPGPGVVNLVGDGIFLAKYNSTGQYIWAFALEGGNVKEMVIDNDDNIYITGNFVDTIDFDPSTSNLDLISQGSNDIFLAKYDSLGSVIWANSIGSTDWDEAHSIAIDNLGNLYITGVFRNAVDFDPSPDTAIVSSFFTSIFLAKYDSLGSFIWAHNLEGNGSLNAGYTVAWDGQDGIVISGKFTQNLDFDFTNDTFELTVPIGPWNCYLAKYDTDANFLWAGLIGGNGLCNGYSIAADSVANIYLTGEFSATIDFDPSIDTSEISTLSGGGIFLAKYNSNGELLWANEIGGNTSASGRPLALDERGNIYLTGSFQDTNDFNPSPVQTAQLIAGGDRDMFLAVYNLDGNYVWAYNVKGDSIYSSEGMSLAIDEEGHLYGTGYLQGPADFDPSPINSNTYGASQDFFVTKYTIPDSIVSIRNNSHQPEMVIYPNPSSGQFTVELSGLKSEVAYLEILSSTGQVVYCTSLRAKENLTINSANYSPGLYLMKLQTGILQTTRLLVFY